MAGEVHRSRQVNMHKYIIYLGKANIQVQLPSVQAKTHPSSNTILHPIHLLQTWRTQTMSKSHKFY